MLLLEELDSLLLEELELLEDEELELLEDEELLLLEDEELEKDSLLEDSDELDTLEELNDLLLEELEELDELRDSTAGLTRTPEFPTFVGLTVGIILVPVLLKSESFAKGTIRTPSLIAKHSYPIFFVNFLFISVMILTVIIPVGLTRSLLVKNRYNLLVMGESLFTHPW